MLEKLLSNRDRILKNLGYTVYLLEEPSDGSLSDELLEQFYRGRKEVLIEELSLIDELIKLCPFKIEEGA